MAVVYSEPVISREEMAELDEVVVKGIHRLTDKLQDFWDFYALSLIPFGFDEYADSLRRAVVTEMAAEYEKHLEREVWDEVFTTKFPHTIGDHTYDDGRAICKEDLSYFTKTTGVTWSDIQAMVRGERVLSLFQLEKFFRHYPFPENYGGDVWANIARGLIRLKEARTTVDKVVWLDHIHDLEHNTGSIMDKWSFVDEDILSEKRDMQPRDYLSKVSHAVRQVLSLYLRYTGEQ